MSDFLPRLAQAKYADSAVSRPCASLSHGGPNARESSPFFGRSTLITSAPRSARFCAAHGPAQHAGQVENTDSFKGPGIGPQST